MPAPGLRARHAHSIVVGGLGLSQTGTQRAIRLLPASVTLAFAATGNSLQRWMQEARRGGHELLVQVPFEPFDYPANNPGRDTLLINSSETQNLARLHNAMATITNYTGIMNYQAAAISPIRMRLSRCCAMSNTAACSSSMTAHPLSRRAE